MYTNVNLSAPVGALALLGTGFILFVNAILLVYFLFKRKRSAVRFALLAIAVIAAAYLAVMLGFSWASHEQVLARGQEKHFCELDCHLAYSVINTRQTKTIGDAPNQLTARDQFTVITIKTRFDETTIAPGRGGALLYPNSRAVTLVDDRGNRYAPSAQSGTPFTSPLHPGESYTTEVVFDLPAAVKPVTLLIKEGDWVTHLVIGHENSPLHKQAKFQI
jgi:hypothetical protein